MKHLSQHVHEALKIGSSSKVCKLYRPLNESELRSILRKLIAERGAFANLNDIDTSHITDMSNLFSEEKTINFNGDISQWDVSSVENMENMFLYSAFNHDISNWNVTSVENMSGMFAFSHFNKPINKWDVSNVHTMKSMFAYADFNQPIGDWDVTIVDDMSKMFKGSKFNQDISKWTPETENMSEMFYNCPLEKNPPKWYHIDEALKVGSKSKVNKYHYHPESFSQLYTLIRKLIKERGKNADLNDIDTSMVKDMSYLFQRTDFNGDISGWDVSNVEDMRYMFCSSSFNGDIEDWSVRSTCDIRRMFKDCPLEKNPPKWYNR